jgi:hypothetical protein
MNQRKVFFALFALVVFFAAAYFTFGKNVSRRIFHEETDRDIVLPPAHTFSAEAPSEEKSGEETAQKELPSQFLLSVPFTPQAPTANWDELHNEACEEASALMANAFFQGDERSTLPATEAEKEIEKLTKWQQDNLGYNLSIDSEETVRMIEAVYGLKAEIVRDFSEDTIKIALTHNKLVLAPVNGRQLGNPYFQTPGPIYHMFVIKGYDEKSFIVNEPGTKHGQDYRYTYQTLKSALGDYDHDTKETDPSKSALIIVSK